MRRATIPALVVVAGLLLLVDYLVVNASLGELAGIVVDAAILVSAGAALAAVAALAVRRAGDLWRRRGDPVGAVLVLAGMAAVLLAGLRPGASGASDPAVLWILNALLVPLGASLFGLLFVSTLLAFQRSISARSREAIVMALAAVAILVLLLPVGGTAGGWLDGAAAWALAVPIGGVFRGLLLGIAILGAVVAARTMLGIGAGDE
ncbi:MAG TPA: hypothetical protein VFM03_00460 [Candidatus Limnocylindria bacterium]|nr:hypothetical protein [Candidatus Limnocylindria bacterium]